MKIIGDVHGKVGQYLQKLKTGEPSFQVGDMGLGFPGGCPPMMERNHRFIRGNHDNPEDCRKHPNYAGEYGYDPEHKLFFCSGAWSIDRHQRIEGRDWWRDEELSLGQLSEALSLYRKVKPEIVITHDCPTEVSQQLLKRTYYLIGQGATEVPLAKIKTRTDQALQAMFDFHKPKVWVFGHYHISWDRVVRGTRFICLKELDEVEI